MATKKKPEPDDPEQSKLFVDKAKEIGAHKKPSAADKLMGSMASQKPRPHIPAQQKAFSRKQD